MSSLKLNQLRKLISEEVKKSIVEVGEKEKQEKGEDSLDSQIDNYLIDYEVESKASKNEGKDFRSLVRRFLSEAEEAEEAEGEDKEESKKLTSEDLDVDNFVNSVIRLIENYDSLLEVRDVILRRAINFLLKGYEPDVVEAFKANLLDQHGLEVGKSKADVEDEEYEQPTADRAGPGLGA